MAELTRTGAAIEPPEAPSVTRADPQSPAGLCSICTHCKIITSDRGSNFYRCMLSDADPSFPRYPRLPVHTCSGWS